MSPLASRLFQAHANAQRGFYFDAVFEPRAGLFVATSNVIPDPYWNYAFAVSEDGLATNLEGLAVIFAESASSKSRKPALLVPNGSTLESEIASSGVYAPFAEDFWMIADAVASSASPAHGFQVSPIVSPEDVSAAVEVFEDAYTTATEDGVGYEGLPEEYVTAFRRGLERAHLFGSDHLIARVRGEAVAIASVFYSGGAAGLYNVAVSRSARLRGYGRSISSVALANAQKKAEVAFLQTEPNGPVQTMYASAGFRELVHARLWSATASI